MLLFKSDHLVFKCFNSIYHLWPNSSITSGELVCFTFSRFFVDLEYTCWIKCNTEKSTGNVIRLLRKTAFLIQAYKLCFSLYQVNQRFFSYETLSPSNTASTNPSWLLSPSTKITSGTFSLPTSYYNDASETDLISVQLSMS